ncbi:MAG: hypothetical protein LBL28_09365 [Treponema sp.]|jgi:hypothetical protein|nr:hypothetical protein [Treponema sp.]
MKNKVCFVTFFCIGFLFVSCDDAVRNNIPGQNDDALKIVNSEAEEYSLSLEGVPVYWRDSVALTKEDGPVYLSFWRNVDGIPDFPTWGGQPVVKYDQKAGEIKEGRLSLNLPEEIPDEFLLKPQYYTLQGIPGPVEDYTGEGAPGLLVGKAGFYNYNIGARRAGRQNSYYYACFLYATGDGRVKHQSGGYVELKKGWNFLVFMGGGTGEYVRYKSLKELYDAYPFELQTYYYTFDDSPPQ